MQTMPPVQRPSHLRCAHSREPRLFGTKARRVFPGNETEVRCHTGRIRESVDIVQRGNEPRRRDLADARDLSSVAACVRLHGPGVSAMYRPANRVQLVNPVRSQVRYARIGRRLCPTPDTLAGKRVRASRETHR